MPSNTKKNKAPRTVKIWSGLSIAKRRFNSESTNKKSKKKHTFSMTFKCVDCQETITVLVPVVTNPVHKGNHPGAPKKMILIEENEY